jgi:hypothetical protein
MILAPISVGELVDKITILDIKESEYTDQVKLAHVSKEKAELEKLFYDIEINLAAEISELLIVNKIIWDNEDLARQYQKTGTFDQGFIDLANSTYKANTRRAEIKKTINQKCNSEIVETKSYMSGD